MIKFPTSHDIYVEVDGKKIAVVLDYTAKPNAKGQYDIELYRLYATDDAISEDINFYDLSGFSLMICKPDRKIIYSDCKWSSIRETGVLGSMEIDRIFAVSSRRVEICHD